jgi:Ca2+-binding EF-hand superfamily protein
MGNTVSEALKSSGLNKSLKLDGKTKLAANRFDTDEVHVLHKTWQDLADRSSGKGIDKDTFLQYFPLNGLLGERLFAQFDTKGTGFIDFEEFIVGLAIVCRGNSDEKVHFIFNMYDVSHDNTVSRQELTTLLNQVPKEMLKHTARDRSQTQDTRDRSPSGNSHGEYGGANSDLEVPDDNFEEVDNYTNQDVVERAFEECDLNHEGRLSFPAFKMWLSRNPEVLEYIESILPYNGLKDLQPHSHKKDTLPHLRRISSKASMMGSLGFGSGDSRHRLSELAVRHQPSSHIITHHQPSSVIIGHHHTSSIIIDHHQPSSHIITHHHPSSTIIDHHHTSSTIIDHHRPSSTISYDYHAVLCILNKEYLTLKRCRFHSLLYCFAALTCIHKIFCSNFVNKLC